MLDTCKGRLEKSVYPHLGDKPINRVTREQCDNVTRRLPEGLSRGTRRQYAQLMTRIFHLAELAGYVQRSPLPRSWAPKPGPRKRFPILYPGEDRALLGCTDIPLCRRVFYGFLHREGGRRGEDAALQVSDIDLEHGTIALDENKTDHPRWWKLGDGVAEALAACSRIEAKSGPRLTCSSTRTAGP